MKKPKLFEVVRINMKRPIGDRMALMRKLEATSSHKEEKEILHNAIYPHRLKGVEES